jgi:hypothetical protein
MIIFSTFYIGSCIINTIGSVLNNAEEINYRINIIYHYN